jgi:hypothetical protein
MADVLLCNFLFYYVIFYFELIDKGNWLLQYLACSVFSDPCVVDLAFLLAYFSCYCYFKLPRVYTSDSLLTMY